MCDWIYNKGMAILCANFIVPKVHESENGNYVLTKNAGEHDKHLMHTFGCDDKYAFLCNKLHSSGFRERNAC